MKSYQVGSNSKPDDDDDQDPRPMKFRKCPNYTNDVLMRTVAFSYYSGVDVCMRYAFAGANSQVNSLDHNYLSKPMTEYQIDKGNSINEETAIALERKTNGQSKSQKWFEVSVYTEISILPMSIVSNYVLIVTQYFKFEI